VEGLGVSNFAEIYSGRRVLLTGHTGFKGSWLSLWLDQLGAEVMGISLAPNTKPSHWDLLALKLQENLIDIRDYSKVKKIVDQFKPEIVFHLAAQPLVRRSYIDPLETWSINVQGTANVLEACREVGDIRAIVAITTDKCYQNQEQLWGYRENDKLGGHDPYSASKAGAELVAASYRDSYFRKQGSPLLATARAGNVIGGGDWSDDRLIPDLVRASIARKSLEVRSPNATRPWQHVLESLSGYLLLGQKLLNQQPLYADAWNFGPDDAGNQTVAKILSNISQTWDKLHWHETDAPQPHEAGLLHLDSTKARALLNWHPVWGLEEGLKETVRWYQMFLEKGEVVSKQQLAEYVMLAKAKNISWAV
jgi:CDP-glucose 4,6-dehydratase